MSDVDWIELRYHEEHLRELINRSGDENHHASLTALCDALIKDERPDHRPTPLDHRVLYHPDPEIDANIKWRLAVNMARREPSEPPSQPSADPDRA